MNNLRAECDVKLINNKAKIFRIEIGNCVCQTQTCRQVQPIRKIEGYDVRNRIRVK